MNRHCSMHLVLLFVALSGAHAAAQPTLQLHLAYDGSYREDFTPAPYQLFDGVAYHPGLHDPTDIHQFSALVTLDGVNDAVLEESLKSMQFDVVLGDGLTPYPVSPWIPSNAAYATPDLSPPVPLFTINEDLGPDDLKLITIATNEYAADGLDPGENGSFAVGQLLVQWNGSPTSLYLAPAGPWETWLPPDTVVIPEYWDDFRRSINPDGPTDGFDFVPEPASETLAGLAIAGLFGLVRRR